MAVVFHIAAIRDTIEEIGAFAGFAAVVGLGVLAALYFSQARDVKRLREWAGRAPERTAAPVPGAQPQQRVAGPAQPIPQRPAAAGQAAGAAPAPGTAAPAKPGPLPPVPPVPPVPGKAPATPGQPAKPGTPIPAPAATAAGAPAPAPLKPPGAPTPPAPIRAPGAPAPTAPAPAGNSIGERPQPLRRTGPPTSILESGLPPREREPWHRRVHWPEPRYTALIAAGVLVLGAGAAFAIKEAVTTDEPERIGAPPGDPQNPDGEQRAPRPAAVDKSAVTVSVLNGTTVPGLAAQIGDRVESEGYRRGNVTNASDQQQAESVVAYADGGNGRSEARAVARDLGISQIEEVTPDTQALAGDATVVVIVGQDQTQ